MDLENLPNQISGPGGDLSLGEPVRRPIRRLDPEVVAKIAAGEMILRPFSVAKELLENALDAGASEIEIALGESPDQSLQVSDDGFGMEEDDLLLALESHATSKLTQEADLLRVRSLGFRGEALPSIGRVSRMEILSAASASGLGTRVVIEGGHRRLLEPAARSRGTTVRVEDLFYNSPVRKRFLRGSAGEVRLVTKLVATYALAFPEVAFRLFHRGTPILDLSPSGDLALRVAQVHGPGFSEKILPLEHRSLRGSIQGVVGIPELARPGTQQQTLIVNQRWVSAPWLAPALRQGFGDLLPPTRNPFAIVLLEVDPARVDVNVHPTKREVRFLDESSLFGDLVRAVRAQMTRLVPSWNLDPKDPGSGTAWDASSREQTHGPMGGGWPFSSGGQTPAWGEGSTLRLLYGVPRDAAGDVRSGQVSENPETSAEPATAPTPSEGTPASSTTLEGGATTPLIPIWQVHQRYLIAQTRQGIVLIDQHAAHERVLYEQTMRHLQETPAATQQLLFPAVVHLDPGEWSAFQEFREDLGRLGVDVEEFGGQAVLLRGVPALWDRSPEGIFREVLQEVANQPSRGSEERMRQLAASFACRSAVKSGRTLTLTEMNALVDQLFATSMPHGDPHGRPTFIQVSLADLDRRFGRSSGGSGGGSG